MRLRTRNPKLWLRDLAHEDEDVPLGITKVSEPELERIC